MSDYVGDDFVGHASELVNISIEALIAELVDNSLDKKATKIHVEIQGKDLSSLTFVVYDNSPIGFESEDALDQAFRVAGKKDRSDDEIGSFHMGMKISTSSKFNDVAAFTLIDSKIHHRRINRHHTMSKAYEPLKDIVFPREKEVKKALNKNGWTTAICLHNPPSPLFGKAGEISVKSLKGFSKQVSAFFGITYENTLRKSPEVKMTINSQKSCHSILLERFYAGETRRTARIPLTSRSCGLSTATPCPREQHPLGNHFHHANSTSSCVRGCRISNKGSRICYTVRKRSEKLHAHDLTEGVFVEKPTDAGTKTLNAEFLTGFFFYRNDRCIAFGKTGKIPTEAGTTTESLEIS